MVNIIVFQSNARFESLLFKLEVLDHKARERAGVITPTLGSPIHVLLQLDAAIEVSIITKIMDIVALFHFDFCSGKLKCIFFFYPLCRLYRRSPSDMRLSSLFITIGKRRYAFNFKLRDIRRSLCIDIYTVLNLSQLHCVSLSHEGNR